MNERATTPGRTAYLVAGLADRATGWHVVPFTAVTDRPP